MGCSLAPQARFSSAPAGSRARGRPKLLDQVREAIRTRHMSPRTEEAYVHWIKRYIYFHGKRHPREMGPPEITAFLTALAVQRHVSASTQNQALAAGTACTSRFSPAEQPELPLAGALEIAAVPGS